MSTFTNYEYNHFQRSHLPQLSKGHEQGILKKYENICYWNKVLREDKIEFKSVMEMSLEKNY